MKHYVRGCYSWRTKIQFRLVLSFVINFDKYAEQSY